VVTRAGEEPEGSGGRLARAAVAGSALAALAALLAGGRWGEWVFAAAAVAMPVALCALGAVRRGRFGGPLAVALAVLLAVLAGSFLVLFLLRGRLPDGPWIAGLPLAPAVLLGGVWLLPLALVGLAYALTFERQGITEEDLARLRARRRETAER
jgi:hypothetical protein